MKKDFSELKPGDIIVMQYKKDVCEAKVLRNYTKRKKLRLSVKTGSKHKITENYYKDYNFWMYK